MMTVRTGLLTLAVLLTVSACDRDETSTFAKRIDSDPGPSGDGGAGDAMSGDSAPGDPAPGDSGAGDPASGDAGPGDDSGGITVLIIALACPFNVQDAALEAALLAAGHSADCILPANVDTATADGYQVVLVSETISSGDIVAKLTDYTGGLVTLEAFVWQSWGWSAVAPVWHAALTDVNILTTGHPITAPLNTGAFAVYQSANDLSGAATAGSGAVLLAEIQSTGRISLLAYESGAQMATGTAPGRRVGFGLDAPGYAVLTQPAWDMIDRSLLWAAGQL